MPTLDELDALPPGNAAQPQSKGLSLDDLDKMPPGKHGVSLDDIKPPDKGLWDRISDGVSGIPDMVGKAGADAYVYAEDAIHNPQKALHELPDRAAVFGRGAADTLLAPGAIVAKGLGFTPQGADTSKLGSKLAAAWTPGDTVTNVDNQNQMDAKYPGARTLGEAATVGAGTGLAGVSGIAGTALASGVGSAALQQANEGEVNPTQVAADALVGAGSAALPKLAAGGVNHVIERTLPTVPGLETATNVARYGLGKLQTTTAVAGANRLANQLEAVGPAEASDLRALTQPEAAQVRNQIHAGAEGRYNEGVAEAQKSLAKFKTHEDHIDSELENLQKNQAAAEDAANNTAADTRFAQDQQSNQEHLQLTARQGTALRNSIYRLRSGLADERQSTYQELNNPASKAAASAPTEVAKTVKQEAQNFAPYDKQTAQDLRQMLAGLPNAKTEAAMTDGKYLRGLTEFNSKLGALAQEKGIRELRLLNRAVNSIIDKTETTVGQDYDPVLGGRLGAIRSKFAKTYDTEGVVDATSGQKGIKRMYTGDDPIGRINPKGMNSSISGVKRGVKNSGFDEGIETLTANDDAVPGAKEYADNLLKAANQPVPVRQAPVPVDPLSDAVTNRVLQSNPKLAKQVGDLGVIRNSDAFQTNPVSAEEMLARGEQISGKDIPGVSSELGAKVKDAQSFQSAKDRLDSLRAAKKRLPDNAAITNSTAGDAAEVVTHSTGTGRTLAKGKKLLLGSSDADPADLLSRQHAGEVKQADAAYKLKKQFGLNNIDGKVADVMDSVERVAKDFGENPAKAAVANAKALGRKLSEGEAVKLAKVFNIKDPKAFYSQLVASGLAAENQEGQ